jgi:hypothetical protein
MSVRILQVCIESSLATNSRGSNYPSGDNKKSHLLPERNCDQMPKTLTQRFFWIWITLSGEVKVSLSNLPPCYNKPWKLQHSIILQGKKADLKRLILYFTNGAHKKEFKMTGKAEDKEMLMSVWLIGFWLENPANKYGVLALLQSFHRGVLCLLHIHNSGTEHTCLHRGIRIIPLGQT